MFFFHFETSCILGVFLVGFWHFDFLFIFSRVLLMFVFCFSPFGVFVFETLFILGGFYVFFGCLFFCIFCVVFCLCLCFVSLFLFFLLVRLRAF